MITKKEFINKFGFFKEPNFITDGERLIVEIDAGNHYCIDLTIENNDINYFSYLKVIVVFEQVDKFIKFNLKFDDEATWDFLLFSYLELIERSKFKDLSDKKLEKINQQYEKEKK